MQTNAPRLKLLGSSAYISTLDLSGKHFGTLIIQDIGSHAQTRLMKLQVDYAV